MVFERKAEKKPPTQWFNFSLIVFQLLLAGCNTLMNAIKYLIVRHFIRAHAGLAQSSFIPVFIDVTGFYYSKKSSSGPLATL